MLSQFRPSVVYVTLEGYVATKWRIVNFLRNLLASHCSLLTENTWGVLTRSHQKDSKYWHVIKKFLNFCSPLLYYKFTGESVLKEFLKSLNIWQSYGGKVDCLKCRVRRGIVLIKLKNSLENRRVAGRNCCNSIIFRLILLNNLESMIDKMSNCQPLGTRLLMFLVTEHVVLIWLMDMCTSNK